MIAISAGRKGCVGVVDENRRLIGMVTDGDLRRAILAGRTNAGAREVMTPGPRTLDPSARMMSVIKSFSENRISNAFVVDEAGVPTGLIDMKDLLAEGYV